MAILPPNAYALIEQKHLQTIAHMSSLKPNARSMLRNQLTPAMLMRKRNLSQFSQPIPTKPTEQPLANANSDDLQQELIGYFGHMMQQSHLELVLQRKEENFLFSKYLFVQTYAHIPVVGTYALAKVEHTQVTYQRQHLVQESYFSNLSTTPHLSMHAARLAARSDALTFAEDANVLAQASLVILATQATPVLVYRSEVDTTMPNGHWQIFVDAQNGNIVGRFMQNLDAVSGQVTAYAEPNCQGDRYEKTALPYIPWQKNLLTDGQGRFSHNSTPARSEVSLEGTYFRIVSADGQNLRWQGNLQPSPKINSVHLSNAPPSQIDPFLYATAAHNWLFKKLQENPDLQSSDIVGFVHKQLVIHVNLPNGNSSYACNAFYDGISLNFFAAYPPWGCNNSGQSRKIVLHEYGHAVHSHLAGIPNLFDPETSEGVADFFSANLTSDPKISGLVGCNTVLKSRNTVRTCQNRYTYCRNPSRCTTFPGDEPHNVAPVICGAYYDLQQILIHRLGYQAGKQVSERLYLGSLRWLTDVSSLYQALIAADSDADHNPANGTDHSCAINEALLGSAGGFVRFPDLVVQKVPCQN